MKIALQWMLVVFIMFTTVSFGQNGNTCDSAFAMNVPDTLFPYGASLDSGWVWEIRSGWLKFTVPSGKGIEGFMVDMPVSTNCSTTFAYGGGVLVYKGASCAAKVPVDSAGLFNPMGGCYYTNAPALFDSLADGDTYYLYIGSYPFKTRWFTHIVDSFSCSRADTLTSFPFTGCNLANANFMNTPFTNPPFNIPIYYTIIPTSTSVTFTVEAASCIEDGLLFAYVYNNCSFSNQLASSPGIGPGGSYTFAINNAVPGVPLKLMLDGGRMVGYDIFAPSPTLCTFNITNASGLLMPLNVVDFKAQYNKSQNDILLNWTSENELNFDRYEVERSSDGREFLKIGSVKSKSGSGKNAYQSIDYSPLPINYYRLKMVDKDGTFTYSKTERVSFNLQHTTFNIAPNPATTSVQLQFTKPLVGKVQIEVSDVTGKVVMKKVVEGSDVITLSTTKLAAGTYVVKVVSEGEEYVQKMMVK